MKLSVIVPAYNEENSISATIKELKKLNPDEIIVVNDGSTDKTGEILSSITGIKVITHEKNSGYGAALKTGFLAAKNEFVGFVDADLTYPPEMLRKFLTILKNENLDCVWGNRFGGKGSKMSPVRKFGNLMMSSLASIIYLKKVHDINCGERVFRKEILRDMDLESLPDDLNFITGFTKRIVLKGKRYKEIPMTYHYREGESKLKVHKHGFLMLRTLLFG